MQARTSYEKAVCSYKKAVCLFVRLSVYSSVKSVTCDKTKESCAHKPTPHERLFTLVLWQKEWLVGG